MEDPFTIACIYGNLKEAQELYINNKSNIHLYDDFALRYACSCGRIEV